jgi:hypothetical protein
MPVLDASLFGGRPRCRYLDVELPALLEVDLLVAANALIYRVQKQLKKGHYL